MRVYTDVYLYVFRTEGCFHLCVINVTRFLEEQDVLDKIPSIVQAGKGLPSVCPKRFLSFYCIFKKYFTRSTHKYAVTNSYMHTMCRLGHFTKYL